MTEHTIGNPFVGWKTLSTAERNAAFNNNAAVSDSEERLAKLAAASEALRQGHPRFRTILYGGAEPQGIDLFPGRSSRAPCLVFIHGGYWQRNSRQRFAAIASGVLSFGWSAVLVGHTLAPEATLTEIAGQISNALDWLSAHGTDVGIMGPIWLSGWSSGAHLAAISLAHNAIRGGLFVSGVFELEPIVDTALNDKLKLTRVEVESLSPLRWRPSNKPVLVSYGTSELPAFIENSERYHAIRQAAGAPGQLLPIRGGDHFSILDELISPKGALTLAAQGLFS